MRLPQWCHGSVGTVSSGLLALVRGCGTEAARAGEQAGEVGLHRAGTLDEEVRELLPLAQTLLGRGTDTVHDAEACETDGDGCTHCVEDSAHDARTPSRVDPGVCLLKLVDPLLP